MTPPTHNPNGSIAAKAFGPAAFSMPVPTEAGLQVATRPNELQPAPSPVRASNAEREEIVGRLHDALEQGRLDLDETEERVAAAYTARYRTDLAPLLSDLPDGPARRSEIPTWRALWELLVWRARIALGMTDPGGTTPPTRRQRRVAAGITGLAVAWVVLCAVLAAVLVAL
jgi:hypothetical protein